MPIEEQGEVAPRDRSIVSLLKDLKDDSIKLALQHARLAKLSFSQQASEKARSYGIVAAGGAIGLSGFVILLSGVASLVSMAFGEPSGARAAGELIVGTVVASAGVGFAYLVYRRLGEEETDTERLSREKSAGEMASDGAE